MLYAGWFCPFVQRVWMVLEEKQVLFQYIEVDPYHKPQSLMSLNPRGLLPTLEYHGKPLYESTVICEFLEETYPDQGPKLQPQDTYDRARMRIWVDFVTSRLIPAFYRLLQCQEREARLEELRRQFAGYVEEWASEIDPQWSFFMGKEPTLVDFAFLPWAERTWVLREFKGGDGIPAVFEKKDDPAWRKYHLWFRNMMARESVQSTLSKREHYMPIYQR